MLFTCDACGIKKEYDPSKTLEAMPSGWRMHEISGHRFLLCSSCGNPAAFYGEISPHLKEMLEARHNIKIETP